MNNSNKHDNLTDEHSTVASFTECTGLIAAFDPDQPVLENQTEMYGIHPPKEKKGEPKCKNHRRERGHRPL